MVSVSHPGHPEHPWIWIRASTQRNLLVQEKTTRPWSACSGVWQLQIDDHHLDIVTSRRVISQKINIHYWYTGFTNSLVFFEQSRPNKSFTKFLIYSTFFRYTFFYSENSRIGFIKIHLECSANSRSHDGCEKQISKLRIIITNIHTAVQQLLTWKVTAVCFSITTTDSVRHLDIDSTTVQAKRIISGIYNRL